MRRRWSPGWAFLGVVLFAGCGAEEPGEEEENREEAEEASHLVELSADGLAAARIATAEVRRGRLEYARELPCEITADPDRVAQVGPRATGRVARVLVRVGDRVIQGQPLALVESGEFARARADLRAATARFERADASYRRRAQLHTENIASERSVEEARAERRAARAAVSAARGTLSALGAGGGRGSRITLSAPLAGVIISRDAVLGQSVTSESTLFTIADLSEVWAIARVYERDLGEVRIGGAVELTAAALGDHPVESQIDHITSVLRESSRTADARIILSNPDGALRPGMFCEARVTGTRDTERAGVEELLVPASAVQRTDRGTAVFVRLDEHRFEARAVRIRASDGDRAAVEAGLTEGEVVVTDGSLTLRAELERDSFAEDDD